MGLRIPRTNSPSFWIDTDVALGASHGDVDDGFALAAVLGAARRGDVSIAGISTVFGNISAWTAEECARRLCLAAGLTIPVVRGAGAPRETTEAAQSIAALEEGSILALGPLTNVAAACRRDPELPARATLAVVGGNLSSRGPLPPLWPHEFNLTRDPAAAREVFSQPWRSQILYPLDVVSRLRVGRERLAEIAAVSPLGDLLARGSRRWLARSRWLHPRRGFPVWDLPAALDALGVLEARHESLPTPAVLRLLTGRDEVRCLVAFDPEAAWQSFLALLEAGAQRPASPVLESPAF